MKMLANIFKKCSQILVLNLFITGVFFVQNVICVRLLTAKVYGSVVVASTLIVISQTIVGMRTGELVLKYLSKNESGESVWPKLFTIFRLDVSISVVLFLIILSVGYLSKNALNLNYTLLFILSFNILFSIGTPIFENIFIIYENVLKQYGIKAFHAALSFVIVSGLTFLYGLTGYLIGLLSCTLLKTTLFFFFSKRELKNHHIPFQFYKEKIPLEGLWQFSKHSFLSTTFKSGIGSMDILLLSIASPAENVASYKIAKNLAMIPGAFLGSLWNLIQPRILRYSKESKFEELFLITNRFTKLFMFVFVCLETVLIFNAKNLIILVYGAEYANASMPFLILFSGFWIAYSIGAYGRTYYLGQNRMYMMTILNGITFSIILVLGYIFSYSITYMAWVVIIGLLITSVTVYSEVFLNYIKNSHYTV